MKWIIRDEWPRDLESSDVDTDVVFDPGRIAEALRRLESEDS